MQVIAIGVVLCSVWFVSSCNGQLRSDGLFTVTSNGGRSIAVDYENDRFLLDGKPFRYISGSFHYFRATPESWRRIIRLMKAAGLNAVSTYVEWSLHNPSEGEFNWSGMADLERFIVTCKEEGMFVLLRPGPYICAERDLGGFPVWLLKKYPAIRLRTTDQNYLNEVEKWYSVLMPKMQPHLYGRGGNIILVQVENEYGSFGCDFEYTYWLKDLTERYVNHDALLYTTDGGSEGMVRCGHINGTVQSIDFGTTEGDVRAEFQHLRKYYPRGPLINSEYYAGWLSHWEEGFPNVDAHKVAKTLDKMLQAGVNVNFYVFYGGTNFGFTSGANYDQHNEIQPQTTSYDYDAPLNEAGDVTEKYWKIRNVTSKYVDVSMPVPENTKKLILGPVPLDMSASLFNPAVRNEICQSPRSALDALDFEVFNQRGGLMIYEADLPRFISRDPELLSVKLIRDRALVYVDRSYMGLLNRKTKDYTITFPPNNGNKLQMIVEDQGRINYGTLDTWKGVREVKIGGRPIQRWNSTACPLNNIHQFSHLIRHFAMPRRRAAVSLRGPTFFVGQVTLSAAQVLDTFMDVTGWSKGVAYINGNNLGRYWSSVGPQKALYVPKEFLKSGANEIILLEYQAPSNNRTVAFIDHPLLRH